MGRHCRYTNGRSKRTYELTSSIVPRGTSFHRSVELECSPIAFDPARFSCCCRGLFPGPAELSAINPYAVHDDGQSARQGHDRLFHAAAPGDLNRPSVECARTIQNIVSADSIIARRRHAAAFFNSIGQKRTSRDVRSMSALPPDNGHSGAQLARPHWARTRQSTAQSKLSFEGPASAEARECWCGQSGNWAIAKIALIKAASRTIFSIAHIHASLLPERTIGSVWLAQNVKRGCRQNNRSHACEHDNR